MSTTAKRVFETSSSSSYSMLTPPSKPDQPNAVAKEVLVKRPHSSSDLNPQRVSIETAPSIPPGMSNRDYTFEQIKLKIDRINKKLTELATPEIDYQHEITIQSSEISLLNLIKKLDDPDCLFTKEQKFELYKKAGEGFVLLRAALVEKNPSLNLEEVSSITRPRTSAITSRLQALEKGISPDPFPIEPLIPAPGKRNKLFKIFRSKFDQSDFLKTLHTQLKGIKDRLEVIAAPNYSSGHETVIEFEKPLFVIVQQLEEPRLFSVDQKIELLTYLQATWISLKAAFIAKFSSIPLGEIEPIHQLRVNAIQARLDALNNTGSLDPLPPFPTKSFKSLLPQKIIPCQLFTDTNKKIEEMKKRLTEISSKKNDAGWENHTLRDYEESLLFVLTLTDQQQPFSSFERIHLLNSLSDLFGLLKAAFLANNSHISTELLNAIHKERIDAIKSRLKLLEENSSSSFPTFQSLSLFQAIKTSRAMKIFWLAMTACAACLAIAAYRRFYTKR